MNRRTFLSFFAALAALPVFGRKVVPPVDPLAASAEQIISERTNLLLGGSPIPEWVVARADRRIEPNSVVVWDFIDRRGIPRIRPTKNRADLDFHARWSRVGITNCRVDQHHYTVINTRGGQVRVVGAI